MDKHGVKPFTTGGYATKRSGRFTRARKLHEHIIGPFHSSDITGVSVPEKGSIDAEFFCEMCLQEFMQNRDAGVPTKGLLSFKTKKALNSHYRLQHGLTCELCKKDPMVSFRPICRKKTCTATFFFNMFFFEKSENFFQSSPIGPIFSG